MPPSDQVGWLRSEQLVLPRQTLSKEHAEPFLLFMFAQVARKPMTLKLRETASVARYLKATAGELPGGPERAMVDHLADVVWLTLLQVGQINVSTRTETVRFIRQHAHTYLSTFDIERVVKLIDGRAELSWGRESFRPPTLIGKARSVRSAGPARLQDDLTERIYVAYHALRRSGSPRVRGRISAILNQLGLKTHARPGTTSAWTSQEVIERVRQFADRMAYQHRLAKLDKHRRINELERLRDMLVDSWIHGYYSALNVQSRFT
jgi:hypothetical protein